MEGTLKIERNKFKRPLERPPKTRTPCKLLIYKALLLLIADRTGPEPT